MAHNMLSKKAFGASKKFLEQFARPLETALFKHHFEGGSNQAVLAALKNYQNADGGFGGALEPDVRAIDSSALSTSVALQVLRSIKAGPDEELIVEAIGYLLKTFDKANCHWRIIPTSAQQSPHAPWWNQDDRADALDSFSLNPTAEILGYLFDYRHLVPSDIISLVSEKVFEHLLSLEKIEMHELLCCFRLLKTESLPQDSCEKLGKRLAEAIDDADISDPAQWTEYGLRPLQVIDSPDSAFMAGLEQAVAANLDYEISSQSGDGSWGPTWSWGGLFPDIWERACLEWSGIITIEKLLLLRRFERIE